MAIQYIYGTDTVQQGFNKVNENFLNVPSGTTAEILQQAQEYTDSVIANPNLLINSNFTIWQRGTSFSQADFTEQYTADMWTVSCSDSSVTVTVSQVNNGMSITGSTSSSINLKYYMEQADLNKILGKNCTLSYSINDTITTAPLIVSSGTTETTALINITVPISSTATVVNWVKLEEGIIATTYSPKSYPNEFLNCLRYFRRIQSVSNVSTLIAYGRALSTTVLEVLFDMPVGMRILPTVTGYENLFITTGNNASNIAYWGATVDRTKINLRFNFTDLTTNNIYAVYLNQNQYIDFDSDIY